MARWWGKRMYVTQEARDNSALPLDPLLVTSVRRTIPAGYRVVGEPRVEWTRNLDTGLPGQYLDLGFHGSQTPAEWTVSIMLPVRTDDIEEGTS